MSIANEISRLQTAKADIKSAIEEKGVSVPSSASISTYDDYVLQIQTGGGGSEDLKQLIQKTITSIDIPSGTTSIGDYAFYICTSLSSVTIPSSVTSIGNNAFQDCRSLTSVTIPSGVTSIGGAAFYGCSSLSSVTIPNSVTSIGEYAFNSCSGLTEVTIGSGVTSIGNYAFQRCSGLTEVTIPSGVTSIGNYAFRYCSGLTSVIVNATTPPRLGASAFNNTNDCPIYVPCSSVSAYKAAEHHIAKALTSMLTFIHKFQLTVVRLGQLLQLPLHW